MPIFFFVEQRSKKFEYFSSLFFSLLDMIEIIEMRNRDKIFSIILISINNNYSRKSVGSRINKSETKSR